MPEAVYVGSAAKYTIGPYVFTKENPKHEVSDEIANFLRENPTFTVDGKGGARTQATEDEPEDRPIIPSDGFKSREEAIAFAAKWLPNFKLDATRSTAEMQRRIEAELKGLKVDDQGDPLPANVAEAGPAKVTKTAPNKKVEV